MIYFAWVSAHSRCCMISRGDFFQDIQLLDLRRQLSATLAIENQSANALELLQTKRD